MNDESGEFERKFILSEKRQLEAFEKSTLRQQLEFLTAEQLWDDGEKVRDQEFESFVTNVYQIFAVNAADREQSFRNAESKLEGIFRDKEGIRENRFQRKEASREEVSRQEQEMREKRSQFYATIRDLLFQRGRQGREAACEQLEKQLVDQFGALCRFLGDSFAAAEQRRDGVVEELVSCIDHSHEMRTLILALSLNSFLNECPHLLTEPVVLFLQKTIIPYHQHPGYRNGVTVSKNGHDVRIALRCHRRGVPTSNRDQVQPSDPVAPAQPLPSIQSGCRCRCQCQCQCIDPHRHDIPRAFRHGPVFLACLGTPRSHKETKNPGNWKQARTHIAEKRRTNKRCRQVSFTVLATVLDKHKNIWRKDSVR